MKSDQCPYETEVIAAVRSRIARPDLDLHCATCEECAGACETALFLAQYAAPIVAANRVPDARAMWRRLQARRERAALGWSNRARSLCYTIAGAYLVALVVWFLPSHTGFAFSGFDQIFQQVPAQLVTLCSAVALGLILFGLICLLRLARRAPRLPVIPISN